MMVVRPAFRPSTFEYFDSARIEPAGRIVQCGGAIGGRRVNVCAVGNEEFQNAVMVPEDRKLERRPVGEIFCVDIRSFCHQHLNDVHLARIGGPEQRRFVRDILLIDVNTPSDQAFHLLRVAGLGRIMDRACLHRSVNDRG